MSDSQNSAEKEAEQILESAYAEARAEKCPQGKDCAVHFRVNEEYILEQAKYARLITYVGDHVVLTDDNYKYENPAVLLKLILGVTEDLPPQYETSILYVGEGTLGDVSELPESEQKASFRYIKEHNVWSEVGWQHHTTVSMLEAGLIDVSKPLEG